MASSYGRAIPQTQMMLPGVFPENGRKLVIRRNMTTRRYVDLKREDLIALLEKRDEEEIGGIRLTYTGQRPPWQIVRRVKPRRQKIDTKLCFGEEKDQSCNLLVEGENLQAMVALYKYRGQVDLVLTDPPYNTGQDFRYNDKWDEDPNDPDLGKLVPADDGSKHSKWLRFMTPRLWMMKEMLKPGGVFAICIDHREMFRLGMLLDEIFDEENRIAIINWQKSAAPRPDNDHVSTSTEYVLVYAKDLAKARTSSTGRGEKENRRYGNWDNDPEGKWREGNLTAKTYSAKDDYAIQSPFTGELHYPAGNGAWRHPKYNVIKWLAEWGTPYVMKDIGDGKGEALMVQGGTPTAIPKAVTQRATARLKEGHWPFLWFGQDGKGRPRVKTYLEKIKRGKVPVTYWADEDLGYPAELDTVSWGFKDSGRSSDGVSELTSIVGSGHGFTTVKPLKLFMKIIQIWCGPEGIVLDPFAGSGTTGHAVLQLNTDPEVERRFLLVEQGRPERGDPYARTLTYPRLKRAITGERVTPDGKVVKSATPLPGGFRFTQLTKAVDAEGVLALEREEMIDLLLTSHWDQNERASSYLQRLPAGTYSHLFALNDKGQGYFLVWSGPDNPSVLDRSAFRNIAEEAKAAKLKSPYHVYARICTYSGPNIEFYQIPNRILEKLGFNEATEPFVADGVLV